MFEISTVIFKNKSGKHKFYKMFKKNSSGRTILTFCPYQYFVKIHGAMILLRISKQIPKSKKSEKFGRKLNYFCKIL